MFIKEGASDQSITVRFLDTTSGLPATTVTGGTAGIEMWYRRDAATSTLISAIDISDLTTSHTDGGIIHINAGYYRFDVPDAAWAAGVNKVMVAGSATGFMVVGQDIQLAGYNPRELTTVKVDKLNAIDGLATSAVVTMAAIRNEIDDGLSVINLHQIDSVPLSAIRSEIDDGLSAINLHQVDSVPLSAIRSEVDVALSGIGLDHLVAASAIQADVADGSLFGQLGGSAGDWGTFQSDTDSLESIRNRGDAAWITADVDGLATSTVVTMANIRNEIDDGLSVINLHQVDSVPLSAIRAEIDDGLSSIGLDHLISASTVDGDITTGALFTQLATSSGDWSDFNKATDSLESIRNVEPHGTVMRGTDGVDSVPLSAIRTTVRAEVDDGLSVINLHQVDSVPLSAIRGEIDVGLSNIGLDHLVSASAVQADVVDGSLFGQLGGSAGDWGTFQSTTDSLESIRNRGDAAWATADVDGFATSTVLTLNNIRQQVTDGLSLLNLDHLLATSAVDADIATGTVIAQIATSSADWSDFDMTAHSLEIIAGAAGLTVAQVKQQVDEGLSGIFLDKLLSASATDSDIVTGAFLTQIATSSGDWSDYTASEHSLEIIAGAAGLTTSQVRQQVDEGLSAIFLDHLLAVSATDSDVATGAFLPQIATSSGDWSDYTASAHSLEVIAGAAGLTTSQVRIQVDEGLSAIGLDHLVSASAVQADVADGSLFGQLGGSAGDWGTFQSNTDSLESIRDRGDAAWGTADVDGFATSALLTLDNIRQQVTDGLSLIDLDHLLSVSAVDANIGTGTVIAQLATSSADWSDFDITAHSLEVIAGAAGLTTSQVRTQVDEGLSAIGLDHLVSVSAVQADVVDGSLFGQLGGSAGDWGTFQSDTDSLEAIRDRGDAAWGTADVDGFSTSALLTLDNVRQQVTDALSLMDLDHLVSVSAVDANVGTGTIMAQLATSSGDWSDFNKTTDSLESIRNVEPHGTAMRGTDGVDSVPLSAIRSEIDDGLSAINLHQVDSVPLSAIRAEIDDGLSAINLHQVDSVPLSAIRSEVDVALSALGLDHLISASAVQGDVADGSLFGQLGGSAGDWGTFQSNTDSLEAIRDRGDSSWATADVDGFATSAVVNLANIRQQVTDGLSNIGLDHLLATSATDADITTGAFLTQLATSSGDWSDFNKATDSLEKIYDKEVDVETDTQDIQSRLPAALISGRMSSDAVALSGDTVAANNAELFFDGTGYAGGTIKLQTDAVAISGSTEAADNLEASAEVIVTGTAQTGTLSTTQMTTDLTEATDDHYIGRVIIWTSGVLQDQATDITDYAGANGLLTYTAVTEAPSNGDTFIIV
jgi:hypothetical protein